MEKDGKTTPLTRILIVDDHAELRDMLKEAMVLSGYECLTAGNGREALECLASNSVDVVLTDIKMPEMNGLELTMEIKKSHDVDVIVMTGFTEDFTYEEIITRGASDFMLKPVSIAELCMRIRRVLREKALLRERNHAMDQLRESEQRYQELSITDGLTKLFNSRQFYAVLHGEIERSNRYDHPLTVADVAASIGPGLAKAALAGRVDGRLVDTSFLIERDAPVAIVTAKDADGLEIIRHSTAHLLAQAVQSIYPKAQVTIGPVVEDGFYYDFAYKRPFTPEDLAAIASFEKARLEAEVAKDMAATINDIEQMAAALSILAELKLETGIIEEAKRAVEAFLELSEQVGEPAQRARILLIGEACGISDLPFGQIENDPRAATIYTRFRAGQALRRKENPEKSRAVSRKRWCGLTLPLTMCDRP